MGYRERNLSIPQVSPLYQDELRNSHLTDIWGNIFMRASGHDSKIRPPKKSITQEKGKDRHCRTYQSIFYTVGL